MSKVLSLVDNTSSWYKTNEVRKALGAKYDPKGDGISAYFGEMDMRIYGGWLIGSAIHNSEVHTDDLEQRLRYVDPLRFCADAALDPSDLPDTVAYNDTERPLLTLERLNSGTKEYVIPVELLTVLRVPVVKRVLEDEISDEDAIHHWRLTGLSDGYEVVHSRYLDRIEQLVRNKYYVEAQILGEENLIASGLRGLDDAINKFDFERGFKFSTYAPKRIAGQIVDGVRAQSPHSRLVLNAVKTVKEYMNESPDLELSVQVVRDLTGRSESVAERAYDVLIGLNANISLDATFDGGKETSGWGRIDDSNARFNVTPDMELEAKEEWEKLLGILEPREAELLSSVVIDGYTLKEAGEALGVSESRASQLMTNIQARAKALFTK